jgi:hypothetical protein
VTPSTLPLTYDECRARFVRAAAAAGMELRSDPIEAQGPEGQLLTIDSVRLGPAMPRRALVVLSGVHGVEGFVGSLVQCELLGRLGPGELPADMAVLVVHSVNPWGMSWWRRQNESNVDLNRNWRRDSIEPVHNDAYDELHPLACPDTDRLPRVEDLMVTAGEWVEARGLDWVRDGITAGQYRHPDGLHYGGARTEESNLVLEQLVADLEGAEHGLVLDLHTGHGPRGAVTILSDEAPGSPQDRFFRRHFGDHLVEPTVDNPDATTGVKSGQIANGIRDQLGRDGWCSTAVEFGTTPDLEQLAATYQESWVHRHGDRSDPAHAEVSWRYRCCFTPDDPQWVATCRVAGADVVDAGLAAIAGRSGGD